MLPPDKKEISSRVWLAQLVEHQTFNLWAVVQNSVQIGYIAASEFGNSSFITVSKTKNMFRKKSKFRLEKRKLEKVIIIFVLFS